MEAKFKHILVGMTFLIVFSTIAQAQPMEVPVPVEPNMDYQDMELDINKLQITPRYELLDLEPGDIKTTSFKVKNTGDETVAINARLKVQPYSEYIMDSSWVTIVPDNGELEPDQSMEFKVTINIPEGVDRGYYNSMIVFTNDTYGSMYPEPFPNYVNSADLSVDVWVPPAVQIMDRYIHDQLEAGKEYEYEIKLKNTGSSTVAINPELDDMNRYYRPYGTSEPILEPEDFTITSPTEIKAGETAVVTIKVNVPPDAKGYYDTSISLNIDDSYIDEWESMVQLSFQIWKQPTEPFTKTFTVDGAVPVTIEVATSLLDEGFIYGMLYADRGSTLNQKPSFDVEIKGPDGSLGDLSPDKVIIEGMVNLGAQRFPPWESGGEGLYQEQTNYIETYNLAGTEGVWELNIMPHNTTKFQYKIQMGE